MDRDDDVGCKIVRKLDEIHDWAHVCLKGLEPGDLLQAHSLGNKILELLNDLPSTTNAVKFLAMFEVLSVGADVLQHDLWELNTNSWVN